MKQLYTYSGSFTLTALFSIINNFKKIFVIDKVVEKTFLVFSLFFVQAFVIAQNGPDCPSGVCIGPGGSITSGSLSISSNAFYSSITIKNGQTLTVTAGATLYVGQKGTSATTEVVDFQNGSTVLIAAGASLVVNGKLNNSNNSDSVTFNGSVSVTGDVNAGNGSTITGSGTFVATGTVSGPGTIFDVQGDCYHSKSPPTGPSNQSFCSGATVANLVATGTGIKWYGNPNGGIALGTNVSLINGNIYYASQTYTNGCESNPRLAVTVSITPTVGTPISTAGTGATCTQITANWSASANATKYFLDVSTVNTFASFVTGFNNFDVSNVLTYNVTGLTSGTTYYYRVRANNTCGTSASSGTITYATSPASPIASTATAGTGATCTQITANWSASANATKYFLDVSTVNNFASFVTGFNNLDVSNVLTYNVTGLASGTTYYYRVRANNTCGTSASSGTITYATSPASPIASTATAGTGATCTQITANWSASANATKYFLDVSTVNNFASFVTGFNNLDVSNVLTYNVTGLASGTTYYYRVRANNTCGTSGSSGTITYATLPFNTAGTASSNPTTCINLVLTNITHSINGATGIGVAAGLPTGVTATFGSNTITISGTPTVSGTFNYSIPLTGGCGTVSATGTIYVSPIPTTPTAGTITHPNCVTPTGSVVLSNLPSGSWTINPGGFTGNTASATISGLAAKTYNFTVTDSNGCVSNASPDVVLNAVKTNTWDGTNWSRGTSNTPDDRIVFEGNYPPASNPNEDIVGCSCKISDNAKVVITEGRSLKLKSNLDVKSNATLTFENNASLVQIDDVVNSGNIIYKRNTPSIRNTDYVYWSSPVAGFTLGGITSGTLYYSFNNSWIRQYDNYTMAPGIGYIVRGAGTGGTTGPNFSTTAAFSGVPNNGPIAIAVGGAGKNNLMGNPYPSAIDADAFLSANNTVLEGTLYFWTHASAIQLASNIDAGKAGSGAYAYTSDDYSTYNYTGGTGTSGKIAAGQGFFALGFGSGGTATFTNKMRLGSSGEFLDNSNFFKMVSPAKNSKAVSTSKTEKNRIWLNLTNDQGVFKQMLVGYISGATNEYDRGYDGISFNGNSYVDFYSINNNSKFTIQGRALPIADTEIVPLGYSSKIAGDFSISIEKIDGLLADMIVYVEDKLNNTKHDLKAGPYKFNTQVGTFDDRFVISYAKKTLVIADFESKKDMVLVSNNNKKIKIQSSSEIISHVTLYDISGKLIAEKTKVNAQEMLLTNIAASKQVILVNVTLESGQTISKKIIY